MSRKMEYPRIKDADNKLREACLKGIDRRYSSNLKEEALHKLEEELSIIRKQGSASGYVLVNNALTVADAKPNEFYMTNGFIMMGLTTQTMQFIQGVVFLIFVAIFADRENLSVIK